MDFQRQKLLWRASWRSVNALSTDELRAGKKIGPAGIETAISSLTEKGVSHVGTRHDLLDYRKVTARRMSALIQYRPQMRDDEEDE